ncbi:hypothetical protein BDF22DRAFT_257515 [Syncephalis plumigaleata]|nr:hypothetical protein BDF22DRAFT_257515 [Syncephalis plumigaleata]
MLLSRFPIILITILITISIAISVIGQSTSRRSSSTRLFTTVTCLFLRLPFVIALSPLPSSSYSILFFSSVTPSLSLSLSRSFFLVPPRYLVTLLPFSLALPFFPVLPLTHLSFSSFGLALFGLVVTSVAITVVIPVLRVYMHIC